MLRPLSSRVQRSVLNALLWAMTFQLAVVPSKQQNAPGYLGCFVDGVISSTRVLPIGPKSNGAQSVEWCFRYCLERETEVYRYAGLEYGNQCFCGNGGYDYYGKKWDSECRDRCAGNSRQICGDSGRLSVYRISQGVCSNDIGPPPNGTRTIINPPSVSYNLNNFKFFRTRVDFSCNTGYTLHGASSIECIDTGNNNVMWSESVPNCEVGSPTTEQTSMSTSEMPLSTPSDPPGGSATSVNLNGTSELTGAPSTASPSSKPLPNNHDQSTDQSTEIGTIVGIAASVALLTTLVVTAALLWRKRNTRKKESNVAMATMTFTNNTYALPLNVNQPNTKPEQAAPPIYSQVIKKSPGSNDVYATPDDVTSPGNEACDAPDNIAQDTEFLVSSASDQATGCVDSTTHECQVFPVESEATGNHSDGQTSSAPPLTMEGKPGWVENIIYE